jgi:hypothetical protein
MVNKIEPYAPIIMNTTCPNEATPELPMKICSASTITRLMNMTVTTLSSSTLPTLKVTAPIASIGTTSTSSGNARDTHSDRVAVIDPPAGRFR